MPERLEACFYIQEPPEFEFCDGLFHIKQRIGGYTFDRVMSPHVFLQTLRRANQALTRYHEGATVIDFKAASDGH